MRQDERIQFDQIGRRVEDGQDQTRGVRTTRTLRKGRDRHIEF